MESDKQLLQKLEKLETSYLNLEKKVDEIYKNTKRMEEHINFVETTYDKVKIPFHYLMDKVNLLPFSIFKKSEISQCEQLEDKEKLKDKEKLEDKET